MPAGWNLGGRRASGRGTGTQWDGSRTLAVTVRSGVPALTEMPPTAQPARTRFCWVPRFTLSPTRVDTELTRPLVSTLGSVQVLADLPQPLACAHDLSALKYVSERPSLRLDSEGSDCPHLSEPTSQPLHGDGPGGATLPFAGRLSRASQDV